MRKFIVVSLVLVLGAVASARGNLLSNSGFEDQGWSSGAAVNWQWMNPDVHGSSWGNASRENWRAHGGTWEATIRGSWAGGVDGGWWQEVPATPGVTYTFSAWFWADGSWTNQADQGIKIEFFSGTNSGGPIISAVSNLFQGVAESWVQKSVSGVCPAGATWARAVVWASAVGDNGALQCDDASLVAEPGTVILISQLPVFLGCVLTVPLLRRSWRRRTKIVND